MEFNTLQKYEMAKTMTADEIYHFRNVRLAVEFTFV